MPAPVVFRGALETAAVGVLLAACAPRLPLRPSPPEPLAQWARRVAIEIPDDSGGLDAQSVCESVDSARLVGLGEATHGTREFRRLFRAMVKCLAASPKGLDVIFVEASHAMGLQLDEMVAPGGPGNGESLRAYLQGMGFWDSEELVLLLDWVRSHNRKAGRPIRVRGMDVFCWTECPRLLEEHFEQVGAVAAQRAAAILAPLHDGRRLRRNARARAKAGAALDEVSALLEAHAESPGTAMAREHVVRMRQTLHTAGRQAIGPSRDALMADNVIRELQAHERGVVFAHNGHVWSGSYSLPNGRTSPPPMGGFLRDAYGDDYAVVATSMASGRFLAHDQSVLLGGSRAAPLRTFEVPSPRPDAIEMRLSEVQPPVYALDLRRQSAEVAPWPSQPQRTRFLTNTWNRRFDNARFAAFAWTDVVLAEAVDVLVFFHSTHPIEPVRARPTLAR